MDRTAGALLVTASSLQQAGLRYTTAANAGFITGFYVVLIPIIQALFFKRRPPLYVWVCAEVAFLGIYFLSTAGQSHFQPRRYPRILIGAVFWALHVLVISGAVTETPIPIFSAGQYPFAELSAFSSGLFLEGELTVNIPCIGLDGALCRYSLGWHRLHTAIHSAKTFSPRRCSHYSFHGGGLCRPIWSFVYRRTIPTHAAPGLRVNLAAMIAVQILSLRAEPKE